MKREKSVQVTAHSYFTHHTLLNRSDFDKYFPYRVDFTLINVNCHQICHNNRLTSDDIRKQHPRALANQLETLTVSNTRLDDEVRSLQLEQKRLQVALKQARNEATSKQGELVAAEKQKTEEWREKAVWI